MPGYTVITQAVRDEAPKWDGFAEHMASVVREVQGATLGDTAFFVGDPVTLPIRMLDATVHARVYEKYRSFMEGVLAEARTEFGQIADAVVKIAETYERQEEIGELSLREIYGEMEK
jgi:hypothetical protein